jgi:23S rRNA (guanosine2251-2'-O)-methyltransferase
MKDLIYGINPVKEALASGAEIKTLYISAGKKGMDGLIDSAKKAGAEIKLIHDSKYFDTRFPKGHQGVAAVLPQASSVSIDELLQIPLKRGESPFFIILDQIEDPRNLGAIIRTAEASGAHGMVIQSRRQALLGPEAVKASAGAAMHLPVAVVPNIKHAMKKMRDMGLTLIAAEAGPHPAPWEADLRGPLALIIGSEGKGIRRTVLEHSDFTVSLPISGKTGSLNASVAAGILIYEFLRQNPGFRRS